MPVALHAVRVDMSSRSACRGIYGSQRIARTLHSMRLARPPMSAASRWRSMLERTAGPVLLPVVNFMTGPPPALRNGGIWKGIKRQVLQDSHPGAVMTHAFHFLDFQLTRESYDEWLEGPGGSGGFRGWLDMQSKREGNPLLFVDSGGFQLMNGPVPDFSRYGFRGDAAGIFKMQTNLSADAVASLDYPIGPGLPQDQVTRRLRMGLENARGLLRSTTKFHDGPFPYLCLHAVDRESARSYAAKLIAAADELGAGPTDFGIAIGSLVPIRSHSGLVFEIVQGVQESLAAARSKRTEVTPIHVFGVSGSLVPFLYALGVRSFDSSTYAQAAANLRYFTSFPFGQRAFLDLENLNCDCPHCGQLSRWGLPGIRRVLHGQSGKSHQLHRETLQKSNIYSTIAMHNWTSLVSGVERLARLDADELERAVVRSFVDSPRGLRLLSAAIHAKPDWKKHLPKGTVLPRFSGLVRRPYIAPRRSPSDFNLIRYDFEPRSRSLLLMSCSSTKPYSESRTHRFVLHALKERGIDTEMVDVVTVSGLYGPVPSRFESAPAVVDYDFKLTRYHTAQRRLVVRRVESFLTRHSRRYSVVAAYTGSEVYRDVIRSAARRARIILHLYPKKRGVRAFYDQSEVSALVGSLRGPSTHPKTLPINVGVDGAVLRDAKDDSVPSSIQGSLKR